MIVDSAVLKAVERMFNQTDAGHPHRSAGDRRASCRCMVPRVREADAA
jgi:hypothetical protein